MVKALREDTCYAGYPYYNYTSTISNILAVINYGITENETANQISLSPNPACDFIILKDEGSTIKVNSVVYINDVCGRQLMKMPMEKEKTIIDISHLSKGIYFLKVENNKGIAVRKFVKE